jgi:hypothetical protein
VVPCTSLSVNIALIKEITTFRNIR